MTKSSKIIFMTPKNFLLIILGLSTLTLSSCFNPNEENQDQNSYDNYALIFNDVNKGAANILTNDKHNVGDKIIFEVNPLPNYYVNEIIINDYESYYYEDNNKYSFNLKEGVNEVTIFYDEVGENDGIINITNNEGGQVRVKSKEITSSCLTNIYIEPEEGYKIDSIKFNNKDVVVNGRDYKLQTQKNVNFLDVIFTLGEEGEPTPNPDPTPDPDPEPDPKPNPNDEYTLVNEMKVVKTRVSDVSVSPINPYENVNRDTFNNSSSFKIATTYEDAMHRTEYHLMSGSTKEQGHLPEEESPLNREVLMDGDAYLMNATCRYDVDLDGNLISYTVNTLDDTDYKIFKGAGYQTLDDVSAYIFAFGERPANYSDSKKPNKNEISSTWGKFLRGNYAPFSGDTSRYPYESELTGIFDKYDYVEVDFGSKGGYHVGNRYEEFYNNGKTLNRGACRFCYTETYKHSSTPVDVNDRHVFYTWNHYNDFQEYLNYKGGYTPMFGNTSVGNAPNDMHPDPKPSDPYPIKKAIFNI